MLFIILLLFLKFKISFSSFETEYPGIIICQNDHFQQESMHDTETKLKLLSQIQRKNCTHIQGGLYIRGFKDLTKVRELYFDTIKEIDGHLVIESNDLIKISFKNLKIIRGASHKERQLINSSKENFTLEVIGNNNLEELDLSSLRSIPAHNIIFDNNPKLRYLPHMINWPELFSNLNSQKIFIPLKSPDTLSMDTCSPRCRKWTGANQTYCWGASDNQCQKKVLCGSQYSACDSCYYKDLILQGCCSDQCLGGCEGIGPNKCIACKFMLNENKCTESCPGRYSGAIAGSIQNKEFKYHTGYFCSKVCPAIMLPEDVTCVHKCSEGYFKNVSNHCIKCYGDKCKPEDLPCDMMKMESITEYNLNKNILMKLTNCTKIRGYIVISAETFTKNGVTVPMLYKHLNRVEDLEGGFNYFQDNTLKNLTFLKNLKSFRAAYLHAGKTNSVPLHRFAVSKTGLEFLGLKSLTKVEGNFFFYSNTRLCYMNFAVAEIVKKGDIRLNNLANCTGKICDPECSSKGCWGPGNDMCLECRHFNASGICVSNCNSQKGFYSPKNSTANTSCLRCHKECLRSCTGPGPHECWNGCLNKEENGTCVSNCSNDHYSSKTNPKICFPCHSNCVASGGPRCTGNSSVPGAGGCNNCHVILLDKMFKIVECLKTCPEGTYKLLKDDEYISQYYADKGSHTCFPCDPLCRTCVGKTVNKDDCTECKGFWYHSKCLTMCPADDFYGVKIENTSRTCKTCHSACYKGCTGSLNSNCKRCKIKRIYYKDKQFYCNKTCPPDKDIEEIESASGDTVCRNVWESKMKSEENKRIKVTVAVVLGMLFLVIFVIVIIVVCLRRKAIAERIEAELKSRYSNLTEPNSKDEDILSKPPNMGRLVIVSKEDLTFEDESRPLGFGAFGYVYKGKWKIPKDEDTLLKKSSGDFYLPVAIKVIKNMGEEEIESIMQEAKMMASVSHMHCLRFIGVCLSYDKPCLISAYVKEGSLDKYLVRNRNKITSLIMLSWAEQIADGMLYLTKRNIIHRDLAARNVLVNRLTCVQITDFGLAKMLESTKEKEIIIKTGKVPIRWLAIETLTEGKYSHETDVWAYGVTLWEIFTFGKVPYEDQATHDIFDFVLKGGRLSQPDICSLDVYILMINCWLESPNLRPDFQSLMKTFIDYCKNPGRYLSIQGDPYEIPSPNNIEMTNLNNPYYGDHFNFGPTTAETMLPLLNNSELENTGAKDFTQEGETDNLILSMSDKEPLPTRSMNRSNNIFKRFQENRQPQNSTNVRNNNNTPRLVSLASQEEPMFRNQSLISDDDPRYVADPTDKSVRQRQPLKSHLLHETPRFHSNISRENSTPFNNSSNSQSPFTSPETDGYLEPIKPKDEDSTDAEGYLEPLRSSNKDSLFSQDEYMVPSKPNTPRESMMNNKHPRISKELKDSKNYLTMDDEKSHRDLHLSNTLVDDEYLEPKPNHRPLNLLHK